MTAMQKSMTTMEPREMKIELKKLQLVIDEQSPMGIEPHSPLACAHSVHAMDGSTTSR